MIECFFMSFLFAFGKGLVRSTTMFSETVIDRESLPKNENFFFGVSFSMM